MEQNMFDLYQRKNKIYNNILKEEYGITDTTIKSFQNDLLGIVYKFEEKMVEAEVKTKFDEWIDKEINTFKYNLFDVYFKHYSLMLSELLKKEHSLYLNNEKLVNFINLTIEYTKFEAKEIDQDKDRIPEKIMTLDGFESYRTEEQVDKATVRVKSMINKAIDNINIANQKKRFISTTEKTLGLSHLSEIMDINLSLNNIVTENEMDLNFDLNSDNNNSYYNKDEDVTYIKYRGLYFKAYGKYDSIDEFFETNKDIQQKADDYVNVLSCFTEDGYHSQLKEGSYYYVINGEFYKSDHGYTSDRIKNEFNNIKSDLTKIDDLENTVFGSYQLVHFGEIDKNKIQDIRKYSKQNVLNVLNNIDSTNLDDKTKVNGFAILKDSLNAYEKASNYALDHLPWYKLIFKPIVKYIYDNSMNDLVNNVKTKLTLNDEEYKQLTTLKSNNGLLDTLTEISQKIKDNKNNEYEFDKYIDKDAKVTIFDKDLLDKEQISVKFHFRENETEVELTPDDKVNISVDELKNDILDVSNNDIKEPEIKQEKKEISK